MAVNEWLPIETIPEGHAGGNPVLLYYPMLAKDPDFPGHPFTLSNPVYAGNGNAKAEGATHWMPIPEPPKEAV